MSGPGRSPSGTTLRPPPGRLLRESLIQGEQLFRTLSACHLKGIEIDARDLPATLASALVPCSLDKDAPHRFGRRWYRRRTTKRTTWQLATLARALHLHNRRSASEDEHETESDVTGHGFSFLRVTSMWLTPSLVENPLGLSVPSGSEVHHFRVPLPSS